MSFLLMFIYLFIYLPIYATIIYLFISYLCNKYLFIYLSIYLFNQMYLFIYLCLYCMIFFYHYKHFLSSFFPQHLSWLGLCPCRHYATYFGWPMVSVVINVYLLWIVLNSTPIVEIQELPLFLHLQFLS